MRRRIAAIVAVAAVAELYGMGALADDPAREAHAIMHAALLERAVRLPEMMTPSSGSARSTSVVAREHMDRVRHAEAERAAHRRALEHGTRRSGAGRPDRDMGGTSATMHGGNGWNGSWGMDCQDAAGNWRTRDMHGGWMMPGGGGMPMGAAPMGTSRSIATPASELPSRR